MTFTRFFLRRRSAKVDQSWPNIGSARPFACRWSASIAGVQGPATISARRSKSIPAISPFSRSRYSARSAASWSRTCKSFTPQSPNHSPPRRLKQSGQGPDVTPSATRPVTSPDRILGRQRDQARNAYLPGAGGISAIGHSRLLEELLAKVYKVSPEGVAFESAAA